MTALTAYLACTIAITAIACGHHAEDFPPAVLWRLWQTRRGAGDSQAVETAPKPAESRTRPIPSWARTDHHHYEEAA